jgi:hypothetical protein
MTEVQLGAYREGYEQGQADLMPHYSAALDEIYRLRRALAYEAGVTLAHLHLKTFPKSRLPIARKQAERMRRSACGHSLDAYSEVQGRSLSGALEAAGAESGLTRAQWESRR